MGVDGGQGADPLAQYLRFQRGLDPGFGGCFLCGARGVKLTREHIFGQWSARQLNFLPLRHRHLLPPGAQEYTTTSQPEGTRDIRIRTLCEPCNNGWGSRLENQTRRLLEPIIRAPERPMRFHRPDSSLVATWAAKAVMLMELLDPPEMRMTTPLQRSHLRATTTPPPHSVVFAVRVEPAGSYSRHTRRMPFCGETHNGEAFGACVSWVACGAIGFAVGTSTASMPWPPFEESGEVVRLWPDPQAFDWPIQPEQPDATVGQLIRAMVPTLAVVPERWSGLP